MGKARTGKALSVAAAANLAVAGFVPSASAATHAPATTTTTSTTVARQANAIRAQASGFVPKTSAGTDSDPTKSTCNGNVCIGVWLRYSAANGHYWVTGWDQHFFNYGGCHLASWYETRSLAGLENSVSGHTQNCYHSGFHMNWVDQLPIGLGGSSRELCAGFWNVPGKACVSIPQGRGAAKKTLLRPGVRE